jgi:hypothetical protein
VIKSHAGKSPGDDAREKWSSPVAGTGGKIKDWTANQLHRAEVIHKVFKIRAKERDYFTHTLPIYAWIMAVVDCELMAKTKSPEKRCRMVARFQDIEAALPEDFFSFRGKKQRLVTMIRCIDLADQRPFFWPSAFTACEFRFLT